MRALIVEDDPRYGAHVERLLSGAGFLADWERDPDLALERGYDAGYAVIILDLMLSVEKDGAPQAVDGFSLLRRWRKKGVTTPVLVLTASRTDIEDTTASYEWDADYEIKRPGREFDALLLAWAKSRGARAMAATGGGAGGGAAPQLGALKLDLDMREAWLDGALLNLSQTEFNVLLRLMRAGGAWVGVDDIAGSAFGAGCENPQAQVYEYIKRLRQKLGPKVIRNQRGRGYRIASGDAADEGAAGPADDA